MRFCVTLAAVLAVAGPAAADHAALRNAVTGTPTIKSIDAIAFGPDGLLLIGDGATGQLVAIDTKDTTPQKWTAGPIAKIVAG